MFAFSDLAVQEEGWFILRYRVFDLFSEVEGAPNIVSVQGECYGGAFQIYSTKNFPGLEVSTKLTKVRCIAHISDLEFVSLAGRATYSKYLNMDLKLTFVRRRRNAGDDQALHMF